MEVLLRYRGRPITAADVGFIRELIAAHPQASRRALSRHLALAWQWRQANGAPRDMVCRGLMLALHRAGHLCLPAVQRRPLNPLARRVQPLPPEVDATPLVGSVRQMPALAFRQVRRTGAEGLFNSLIAHHHYLGYTHPVGEGLKFMVYALERPVALFAWSSAPRHLAPRDSYIGWSPERRRQNIHLIAYNTRFLVLPWVRVPHLASHVLARMTRMLPAEWERVYGHPVVFAETFVDPTRHRGSCYRAANWVHLGRTRGRGKDDLTHRVNRSIKEVLGRPLRPDFREQLCTVA